MKGYKFYLECGDKKRQCRADGSGPHEGNVIAIPQPISWIPGKLCMEAYGAVYSWPNSDVCGTQCHADYLRSNCIRVSEKVAREIHPKMFNYLAD